VLKIFQSEDQYSKNSTSKELKIENFKASNDRLDTFKSRYSISFKVVCGESKSVDTEIVDERRIKVKTLINTYDYRDIFNADETTLFYKAFPNNKTLSFKNEIRTSGKKSTERLALMLCVNLIREFEKPIVIGKSKKKPSCFKNTDTILNYSSI